MSVVCILGSLGLVFRYVHNDENTQAVEGLTDMHAAELGVLNTPTRSRHFSTYGIPTPYSVQSLIMPNLQRFS